MVCACMFEVIMVCACMFKSDYGMCLYVVHFALKMHHLHLSVLRMLWLFCNEVMVFSSVPLKMVTIKVYANTIAVNLMTNIRNIYTSPSP